MTNKLFNILPDNFDSIVVGDPCNPGSPESSILTINSTNKGFLPPRLSTSQIMDIINPVSGLLAYNTDLDTVQYYDGSNWVALLTDAIINNSDTAAIYAGSLNLLPSINTTADSINSTTITAVKWLVNITDTINGKVKAFEVYSNFINSSVNFTVYGIIGDSITVNILVELNMTNNLILKLTNQESNTIKANITRITVNS